MNRDHSFISEIASKHCILDSFVEYDGYFTSSKGFLPTVVDIIVIPSTQWRSRRMCAHLLLRELQNYNSLLKSHRQENVGSYQKKDTLHPRAKEKALQGGRRGEIMFRIKPHTLQRCSEGSNKPCVQQDPETAQRLNQTVFECLLQRYGSAVACRRGKGSGCSRPGYGITPLGGGSR